MERIYYARNRAIPFRARVTVVKFYPKRRALVEWDHRRYLTRTTLLRKPN